MEFAPKTLMDSHVILALMVTMDTQIVLRVLAAVIPFHPQAATRKLANVCATKTLMDGNVTLVLMGFMNIHFVTEFPVSWL